MAEIAGAGGGSWPQAAGVREMLGRAGDPDDSDDGAADELMKEVMDRMQSHAATKKRAQTLEQARAREQLANLNTDKMLADAIERSVSALTDMTPSESIPFAKSVLASVLRIMKLKPKRFYATRARPPAPAGKSRKRAVQRQAGRNSKLHHKAKPIWAVKAGTKELVEMYGSHKLAVCAYGPGSGPEHDRLLRALRDVETTGKTVVVVDPVTKEKHVLAGKAPATP